MKRKPDANFCSFFLPRFHRSVGNARGNPTAHPQMAMVGRAAEAGRLFAVKAWDLSILMSQNMMDKAT
jgi:hypothetical protein